MRNSIWMFRRKGQDARLYSIHLGNYRYSVKATCSADGWTNFFSSSLRWVNGSYVLLVFQLLFLGINRKMSREGAKETWKEESEVPLTPSKEKNCCRVPFSPIDQPNWAKSLKVQTLDPLATNLRKCQIFVLLQKMRENRASWHKILWALIPAVDLWYGWLHTIANRHGIISFSYFDRKVASPVISIRISWLPIS